MKNDRYLCKMEIEYKNRFRIGPQEGHIAYGDPIVR